MTARTITSLTSSLSHRRTAAPPRSRPCARARPPRADPSRSVTLSLTEYNRLIDLASRPPQAPRLAPVGAVLASADLRVRVDRDTAHGVFNLAGDVLRPGINRVPLRRGRDADRRQRCRPAAAAQPGRRDAYGAAAGARTVRAHARMGRAADFSRPGARRSRCRCRRPAPRARRSTCPAIRPTCTSPPA